MQAWTYPLGTSEEEYGRLVRQAEFLRPFTERLFREAGMAEGQRVLDLGSGPGDVAMLAASIVGPSGAVVGIEQDPISIARARSRIAAAGLRNVELIEADATRFHCAKNFDAVVGRFVLEYVADPVSLLRSISGCIRQGGFMAFHEPAWAPALAVAPHLPLWTVSASLLRDALNSSGADTDIGLALHRMFRQAGLPAPTLRVEVPLGSDARFTKRIVDGLTILRPRAAELGLRPERVGDLNTLAERLDAELAKADGVIPYGVGLVAAWTRIPH
jgi:SAM-dependent methyltransferase